MSFAGDDQDGGGDRSWFRRRVAAADVMCALAACQRANRLLDKVDSQQESAPWSASQDKAFQWLFGQQKAGVFSVTMPVKDDAGETVMRSFPDPAFTGFGLMALQTKPAAKRTAAEQQVIDSGLSWLLTQQNDDGTFGQQVTNYTTCVVVGALSRWADPKKAPVLKRAQKAILVFQNTERGGYAPSDRDYGSIGYGNSQRGDLSNLHFSLDALRQTGLPEDHEALSRCQAVAHLRAPRLLLHRRRAHAFLADRTTYYYCSRNKLFWG